MDDGDHDFERDHSGGRRDPPSIAAIVLAAGAATRYGSAKQVVPIDGEALVLRAVNAAKGAGLAPVIVVVGQHAAAVRAALAGTASVTIVDNPAHAQGIGTSIAAGVAALGARPIDGIAVLTSDQVGLDTALVDRVMAAFVAGAGSIVRPVADGVTGHPVIFDSMYAPELAALDGDIGGAAVIRRHRGALVEVDVGDPEVLRDLDRPVH